MNLSGREKATIFLSILGSDTSAAILMYLPEELADMIASSVNHLPTPTPEALGEVFSDFQSYVALPPSMREEPQEFSRQTQELKEPIEAGTSREKLLSAGSKKIASLLSEERPQIAAFTLSMLPPMQREEVLMSITAGRDQIGEILANLKSTPLKDRLQEKLAEHLAEKL